MYSYFSLKIKDHHITALAGITDEKKKKLLAQVAKEIND